MRYSKPIYERLYDLNREILDKKEVQRQMEMDKFRSQASQILEGGSAKKRENLEQILYEDAERRRKE